LNDKKKQELWFLCVQGLKSKTSNQEKMGKIPLLVLFFFTRPMIFAKGVI
jgi:hypothetical protein